MVKVFKVASIIIVTSLLLITSVACKAEYSLHVAVYSGQGVVTPASGTYTDGTTVTIAAIPDSGWEFDHWTGSISGSENPYTIQMKADKTIGAYFVETQLPTPTPTPIATPIPTSEPTPTPTPTAIPTPTPTPSHLITVSYSSTITSQIGTGAWADHPSAGYVYLIVDMTIQNQGYDSFSVNPFYFPVIVNSVKYDYSIDSYDLSNKLQSVDVLNGGSVTGKLAFEVPEGTTSFSMQYEGYGSYNIQWVPLSQPVTSTPTPTSTQLITIGYSSTTASQIAAEYWTDYPDSGYIYLIVDMTIQNQGCDSFSVNPNYFPVVVNSVQYDYSMDTYDLDNRLQSNVLLSGGAVTGSLVFEVPESMTTFSMQYAGYDSCNIQWVQQ